MGKRLEDFRKKYSTLEKYSLTDALDICKEWGAGSKFDEAVEISMNLGVDTKHADQTVRNTVELPNGTGKKVRIAVITSEDKVEEALKAGADVAGSEELANDLKSGKVKIDFDKVVASPDVMAMLGKIGLGKILGPKGLMPNPKLGTVTPNIADAVKKLKSGLVEFRAEKNGIVHAAVGRVQSFEKDKLEQNVKAFVAAVVKAKPSGAKGTYVQKVSMSTTMGLGLQIDFSSIEL